MTFQAWKMVLVNSMTFHDFPGGVVTLQVWSTRKTRGGKTLTALGNKPSFIFLKRECILARRSAYAEIVCHASRQMSLQCKLHTFPYPTGLC